METQDLLEGVKIEEGMDTQDALLAIARKRKEEGSYSNFVQKMGMSDGMEISVKLSAEEIAVVLALHDNGLDILNQDDVQELYGLIAKLKSEIWP